MSGAFARRELASSISPCSTLTEDGLSSFSPYGEESCMEDDAKNQEPKKLVYPVMTWIDLYLVPTTEI